MQNVAKNHTMKIEMFDGKDTNANNKEKDIEDENKKNIDLSTTDIYSYIISIMYMY